MGRENWTETRKEFEITEGGQLRPIRVTCEKDRSNEFNRKEIIDIAFRSLAALSIAIPIIIFLFQRGAEAKKQKEQFKFDVFINTSTAFHGMTDLKPGSDQYEVFKNKLYYELCPKLLLIGDSQIINMYFEIKDNLAIYEMNQNCIQEMFQTGNFMYIKSAQLSVVMFKNNQAVISTQIDSISAGFSARIIATGILIGSLREYSISHHLSADTLHSFRFRMLEYLELQHSSLQSYKIDLVAKNYANIEKMVANHFGRRIPERVANSSRIDKLKQFNNHLLFRTSELMKQFDSSIKSRSSYLYTE